MADPATLRHHSDQPPVWAIGDIQGCSDALRRLLSHPEITADANARFWVAGDLINRGPGSLDALRQIIALGDRAISILGNHDLHLLGVAAGVRKVSKSDTLDDILHAPDADALLDWLRHRPLAHFEQGHLMVHAGVASTWDVATTLALADEVSAALRAKSWKKNMASLFGNKPDRWSKALHGTERLRFAVNALTRVRLCNLKGRLDFDYKGTMRTIPAELVPWFDVPDRRTADVTIVFGHWSALGLLMRPNLLSLDTGCVWGGQLTAVRLHDRRIVQVNATA